MADDGKRSLYSGGSGDGSTDGGMESLYSASARGGPIKIDCARCGVTTAVSIFDALRRLLRFSFWIPGRTYNYRLQCPACAQRSWVRLHLI